MVNRMATEAPPPTGVLINASDPGATRSFLDALGIDDQRLQIRLTPPGPPRGPFDLGAIALDFYVRDLDQALALASNAGRVTGKASYRFGDRHLSEGRVLGPDGLGVVLIESSHPRPSRLDRDPHSRVSELVGMVWVVPSVASALPFWTRDMGLEAHADAVVSEPSISRMLELREHVPIRLTILGAQGEPLLRLELLEFTGRPPVATSTIFMPLFQGGRTMADLLDRQMSDV